jgi:predicted HicB family RNase H-like nuclease
MSGKRVSIGLKPGVQKRADEWVSDASAPESVASEEGARTVITKRLTIDISEDLHRALKVKAATEGVKMADLVRAWITERCAS